ncbi:MAG: hypothetical protein ACI4OY_13035 [Aristaeellaceae bacterium]
MRYPPKPMQDPLEPVQRYPLPGQQTTPPMQQSGAQQPYPQQGQPMEQPYGQPGQQPYPQQGQPMEQPYSQPGQQLYPQQGQPVEQPYGQPGQQPYPQQGQPMEQPYAQPVQPTPEAGPDGAAAVPLEQHYRQVAGLYFRDTWVMLAALLAVLVVIFIIVRMATRGYLWGLIFVLLAAVAAEFPALQLWVRSLTDFSGGQMLVRTATLQGVAEAAPGLLSRVGLAGRARYCLKDEQGNSYYFTAEKGLAASFGEMEGAEVELAYLPHSHLMAGLSPVRRVEQLSVMDSARERHLRQIFREYLPL